MATDSQRVVRTATRTVVRRPAEAGTPAPRARTIGPADPMIVDPADADETADGTNGPEALETAPSTRAITSDQFGERFERIVDNIGKVIKGKDDIIRLTIIGMLAEGHVLFEDLPGTGKTMLARSIAATINARSSRIQSTPDLLPADVTGSTVLDRKTGEFVFREGPVFANVFLADEINRATPKTQSAMLEAMAERRVSFDGTTHDLPKPFFVLATMNPVEQAGTFPLPEAQLDRFLFKLSLGFAGREAEATLVRTNAKRHAIEDLTPVLDIGEFVEMIEWCKEVQVSEEVVYYTVDLIGATRDDAMLSMPASSRATQSLIAAARVMAASQGRDDVLPDDVKQLVRPVLVHRLMLTADAQLRDETVEGVIERILHRVKVPIGTRG